MDIKLANSDHHVAKIKVIGVGGCGGNLVSYMSQRATSGVDFVAINTDSQALANVNPQVECIQIGSHTTQGLGSGGKPEVARDAAQSEIDRLRDAMNGMDMVFVVAGMGKGTGTGAAPIVAETAREMGVLTVSLVVMPFEFENRQSVAEEGLMMLSKRSDSLIVAPNDKLTDVMGEDVSLREAYLAANELLYNAVCGISDIINKHGEINVDFNDVRSAMSGKGKAVIGSSSASGEDRAVRAAEAALCSELMENVDLSGASNVLLNISGGDIRMAELSRIVEMIKESASNLRGSVTTGMASDDSMGNEIRVTIIVTGVSDKYQPKIVQPPEGAVKEGTSGGFLSSGRRQRDINTRTEQHNGKQHRTPAVLRRQTN